MIDYHQYPTMTVFLLNFVFFCRYRFASLYFKNPFDMGRAGSGVAQSKDEFLIVIINNSVLNIFADIMVME